MSTSPSVHLADAENRDIFDSLESCEKLLTAREVARILSISEKTVYSYVSRNLIPHYKIEANDRFRARGPCQLVKATCLARPQPARASRQKQPHCAPSEVREDHNGAGSLVGSHFVAR